MRALLGRLIPAGSNAAERAYRLTDAAVAALVRIPIAGETFGSVGEVLMWLIALEDLVVSVDNQYWPKRDADPDGAVLPGIRYARNAVVHGETVTATVDERSGAVLGAAQLGMFSLGEAPSNRWKDRASIGFTPTLTPYVLQQEQSYDRLLVGQDVSLLLEHALTFLRDAAGT